MAEPTTKFWRPPTDNDLGNGMHQWAKTWNAALDHFDTTSVKVRQAVPSQVDVTVTRESETLDCTLQVVYRLMADGLVFTQVFCRQTSEMSKAGSNSPVAFGAC